MSMISSMLLGRKQPPPPPPPPQHHQQQPAGQKPATATGSEAAAEPPLSIDILEQPPPFADGGLSLAAVLGCLGGGGGLSSSPAPASMDWKETATAHVFMADVPGLRREDVKVELGEEKLLRISGQRAAAADDKAGGVRWHRVERAAGERFSRTVRLPANASADAAGVHASLENGVLTVTIPKDDARKAYGRIIPITN